MPNKNTPNTCKTCAYFDMPDDEVFQMYRAGICRNKTYYEHTFFPEGSELMLKETNGCIFHVLSDKANLMLMQTDIIS